MDGHAHAAPGAAFWPLAMMWFGMMTAMMAPTAWPWVRAFHRFHHFGGHASDFAGTTRFASGYLLAWLVYAFAAAVVQRALQRTAMMSLSGAAILPRVGALVLLIAGLYQFTPLKRACLTHCRTPLGYFLARWQDGRIGAMRMGLHHGLFCIGCCWALMTTAFAVGMMNGWWMAALSVLTLREQTAPQGEALRRSVGWAFLFAGMWWLAAP